MTRGTRNCAVYIVCDLRPESGASGSHDDPVRGGLAQSIDHDIHRLVVLRRQQHGLAPAYRGGYHVHQHLRLSGPGRAGYHRELVRHRGVHRVILRQGGGYERRMRLRERRVRNRTGTQQHGGRTTPQQVRPIRQFLEVDDKVPHEWQAA